MEGKVEEMRPVSFLSASVKGRVEKMGPVSFQYAWREVVRKGGKDWK